MTHWKWTTTQNFVTLTKNNKCMSVRSSKIGTAIIDCLEINRGETYTFKFKVNGEHIIGIVDHKFILNNNTQSIGHIPSCFNWGIRSDGYIFCNDIQYQQIFQKFKENEIIYFKINTMIDNHLNIEISQQKNGQSIPPVFTSNLLSEYDCDYDIKYPLTIAISARNYGYIQIIGYNEYNSNNIKYKQYKKDNKLMNTNTVTTKYSNYYKTNDIIHNKLSSAQILKNIKNVDINNQIINDKDDDDDNKLQTKSHIVQHHLKKVKKYLTPSDELNRLKIREDIRNIISPNIVNIKNILKNIGFEEYVDNKAYDDNNQDLDLDLDRDDDEDDDLYYNDDDDDRQFVDMISNTNSLKRERDKERDKMMLSNEPPQKKAKQIKCDKCFRIFTLDVDLLLHKTNDKC